LQYDSTHGYIAPGQMDWFVASFIATFGGQSSKPVPKGLDDGNTTFLFSCPQGSET
jgi:hypothetical protein